MKLQTGKKLLASGLRELDLPLTGEPGRELDLEPGDTDRDRFSLNAPVAICACMRATWACKFRSSVTMSSMA